MGTSSRVTHDMTWEEYEQIKKTENLLDKDVVIKRAMGFRTLFFRMLRKCFVSLNSR